MTLAAKSLEDLRSLLPSATVREREGKPVTSPQTTEEVATITRYANAHKLSIEILGAGTKRGWGNPVTADLLLDTTKLTGVRQHSWQDLTATVAAGTPWATMQRALAQHNQQVALDPLWPETATVGGIIATNDSGAWRLKYGSLRDLIIGMTIVLADSTIAKSGGKVVKNVAGYDLHKLMTGAFGTLGIITEVTFRLHPIPQHTQTFTVDAGQAEQLEPLMAAIRDSHLLVEAVQLRGDGYGFHLDIQLSAHPEARHAELLTKTVEGNRLTLKPSSTEIWRVREVLFANDNAFVAKCSTLPADLTSFGERVMSLNGVFVAQSIGTMITSFDAPGHTTGYGVETLRAEMEERGGSLSILKYPNPSWSGLPADRINSTALPLMREIKHRFDPNRILNPGRFIGGI